MSLPERLHGRGCALITHSEDSMPSLHPSVETVSDPRAGLHKIVSAGTQ